MPIRTIATFAIAGFLGLIAVILINMYMSAPKKTSVAQAAAPGSPVVVAALPIGRGVVVQPQLLKIVNYPAGSVPLGAFSSVSQLTGGKDVQRVALRDLQPDEPVLATRVTPPGGHLNLATTITPGMQAISIHSNDVTGVGGFVLPGDRVDVLLTRTSAAGVAVTQVLAENLRVLGVDQTDNDETDKPMVVKAVTIEVTPEQAQVITLAQSVGAVSLSLRHVQDVQPLSRTATTVAALGFGAPRAAAPATPPVKPRPLDDLGSIRVTRQTETTVYQIGSR